MPEPIDEHWPFSDEGSVKTRKILAFHDARFLNPGRGNSLA
jgi:hypothetical protein